MNKKIYSILYWAARLLSFALLILLLLFSFDVFLIDDTPFRLAIGFLIHNIPVILLLITIIVGWKREWIPSIAFMVSSLGLFMMSWINDGIASTLYVLPLVIPGIIVSVLYFFSWTFKNKISVL